VPENNVVENIFFNFLMPHIKQNKHEAEMENNNGS